MVLYSPARWLAAAALLAPAAAQYDHRYLARELAFMADAVNCGDSSHGGNEPLQTWDCNPCRPVSPPAGGSTIVENATLGTYGVVMDVLRANEENSPVNVLIIYRGIMVSQNCESARAEELVPSPWSSALRVHRGFYSAYASVRDQTMANIARIQQVEGRITRFVVAGWGMGAAMATFLTFDLRRLYPQLQVVFYGYGTPRQGDAAFAAAFRALTNTIAVAIRHRGDSIPECNLAPPRSAACNQFAVGFRQAIGTTVWYPNGLAPPAPPRMCTTPFGTQECSGFDECDSDTAGCGPEWGSPDLSPQDHLYYRGHLMLCCAPPAGHDDEIEPESAGGPSLTTAIVEQQCTSPELFGAPCPVGEGRYHHESGQGARGSAARPGVQTQLRKAAEAVATRLQALMPEPAPTAKS